MKATMTAVVESHADEPPEMGDDGKKELVMCPFARTNKMRFRLGGGERC